MNKDITLWSKSCIDCQSSKITRHVHMKPAHFLPPESRFKHLHTDIVGPLPNSEGFTYLLSMIDRFSRWTEAVPLRDISAETVTRALYDNWISRFGFPDVITTDQGTQFESRLMKSLVSLLGCKKIRTTAYHPASNGMIERWHWSVKAAIMCHANPTWTRSLSTVLLGLRTNLMKCGSSPAEYVDGTTLQIPGEFVLPTDEIVDQNAFLTEFKKHMNSLKPVPVQHNDNRKVFVHKDLSTCTHVFLRVGGSKRSL
ncbi:uncharacterized protein K02A2.6-like [Leptopilina boulardi]|uniref:uncharacterized protein K02A2.6-like n=1 Tax=Leptopilina boulardi TaxID=63433 RepID=UPI0021F6308A|nr:uncharacterized protein K02A2.6-like [Leptopilina boulardi]XP_051175590.1 uncharacterized protein K02A2.6-like [Leptopilina boulardi]